MLKRAIAERLVPQWLFVCFLKTGFITGECRMGEGFFRRARQIFAGILDVFQDFLAKAGEKFAVKLRAAAIGTAS